MRPVVAAILYSNVFIAFAGAALTAATTDHLVGPAASGWRAPAFVFVATVIVYNLDRLVGGSGAEDDVDATHRHEWIGDYQRVLWGIVVVSAVVGLGLAWHLPWRAWWVLAPLGVLATGYAVPLYIPGVGVRRLKEIPGLKMALVVIVWAGATVLFPAACFDVLKREGTWLHAGLRALFIFALTLPFDVRDRERDRRVGIRTIPHLIGAANTTRLAVAAMFGFGLVSLLSLGWSIDALGWPYLGTAAVSTAVLAAADEDRSEAYFVGAIDGMILLHAAAIWVWLPG